MWGVLFLQKHEPLLKTGPSSHAFQEQKCKFSAPIRHLLLHRRFSQSQVHSQCKLRAGEGLSSVAAGGFLQCPTHRAGPRASQLKGNTVFIVTPLLFHQTIAIYKGELIELNHFSRSNIKMLQLGNADRQESQAHFSC